MHEALIDLSAVHHNARQLLAGGGRSRGADLRADAYGHGVVETARTVIDAGFDFVLVSDDDRRLLRDAGISDREVRLATPGEPVPEPVDPALELVGPELYGIGGDPAPELGIIGAMRVSARVTAVKSIPAGAGISYGLTYRVDRRSTIALVPLGYATGLHRSASNRGMVTLGGALRPIAGRVAMNEHVLNLGDHTVEIGDEAVLFGAGGATVDHFAASIGQNPLEVVAGFGMHLQRSYA